MAVFAGAVSSMVLSNVYGTSGPGLPARRCFPAVVFHGLVTVVQMLLWWRFTEGTALSPAAWVGLTVVGVVVRSALRVWTILEGGEEKDVEVPAEVASRPGQLFAFRCFYVFIFLWQVVVSSFAGREPHPSAAARRAGSQPRRGCPCGTCLTSALRCSLASQLPLCLFMPYSAAYQKRQMGARALVRQEQKLQAQELAYCIRDAPAGSPRMLAVAQAIGTTDTLSAEERAVRI